VFFEIFADVKGNNRRNKSGFAFDVDPYARDEVDAAYADYQKNLTDAWRNPPTGAGSRDSIGQCEGDLCTINGAPGHLNADLVCVPDHPATRADHAAIMDHEYDRYDQELRDQWRRP
jgi:hypothetical protein